MVRKVDVILESTGSLILLCEEISRKL